MLTAQDIMTAPVIWVGPSGTVREAADLLISHGISAVPVVEWGRLLGILSERDLVHRAEIGTTQRHRSWWLRAFTDKSDFAAEYVRSHSTHVTDVMTRDVTTLTESMPITVIADILENARVRRAPVIRGGRVVGMVSRADLVRTLTKASKCSLDRVSLDDESIRGRIEDALRCQPWSSAEETYVTVTDGVVKFRGAYLSECERRASHVLAENIMGVRAIDDHRIHLDVQFGVA